MFIPQDIVQNIYVSLWKNLLLFSVESLSCSFYSVKAMWTFTLKEGYKYITVGDAEEGKGV